MKDLQVIIVGAGIGGLQSALALAARSFKVIVLEAIREFTEIGAGIRVPPNSNLLSQSWGVDFSRIKKNVSSGNRFVDWKGKRLLDVSFQDDLEARYGAPYYFLHRADLMNLLLDTATAHPNIEVRFGSRVVEYDFGTPLVHLEDGEIVSGDLIVCSDGIKSTARDVINGEPCPPIDTGDVAYRILVPAAPLRDNPATKHLITDSWATHWIGPSAHAVGYPLRGGELYNIIIDITHDTDPSPPLSFSDWMQKHSSGELLDRFCDWCPEVRAILALTGTYLKWKLADFTRSREVDQLDTWVHKSNRAVLLGDSCHPMMPFVSPKLYPLAKTLHGRMLCFRWLHLRVLILGAGVFPTIADELCRYMAQGAAQATEDAACLAACLNHFPTMETALAQYQQQRLPRTTYIARNTRVLQDWWHVPDGPLKSKRDDWMTLADDGNPMFWGSPKRLHWLFGHDASQIVPGNYVADNIPPLPPQVSPEDSVYRKLRGSREPETDLSRKPRHRSET